MSLVAEAVDTVGDRTEIWMDTGVMSGADIVAAVALGARTVLVGRAYLYGLMAGGEAGVERAATILAREMRRTMQLLGVRTVSELGPPSRADSVGGHAARGLSRRLRSDAQLRVIQNRAGRCYPNAAGGGGRVSRKSCVGTKNSVPVTAVEKSRMRS